MKRKTLMHHSLRAIAVCVVAVTATASNAFAGAMVTFGLGAPIVTSGSAVFDVTLEFAADAGDTLEAIQLSVFGSHALLTAGDTDFSRFAFAPDSGALPTWLAAGTLGASGVELLFPADPFLGPFLGPTGGPATIGTLMVDLTGIPGGTDLLVTLAGGPPGLNSDAGGTVGGTFVPSLASDPAHSVVFDNPDGVAFRTPGSTPVIPEPGSLVLWGVSGVGLFGRRWGRRRQRARA